MNTHNQITKTEKLILQLIAYEFSTKEISDTLFISTHTVETHRANLMKKLGAKKTAGLVRIAIENDLLMKRIDLLNHHRIVSADIFDSISDKVLN